MHEGARMCVFFSFYLNPEAKKENPDSAVDSGFVSNLLVQRFRVIR